MDIFCASNKCPICESDMIVHTGGYYSNGKRRMQMILCKNDCFLYEKNIAENGENIEMFIIFDEQIQLPMFLDGSEREEYYQKVRQLVQYWRENDRYVTELLLS